MKLNVYCLVLILFFLLHFFCQMDWNQQQKKVQNNKLKKLKFEGLCFNHSLKILIFFFFLSLRVYLSFFFFFFALGMHFVKHKGTVFSASRRRLFWITADLDKLLWGSSKSDVKGYILLKEVLSIRDGNQNSDSPSLFYALAFPLWPLIFIFIFFKLLSLQSLIIYISYRKCHLSFFFFFF